MTSNLISLLGEGVSLSGQFLYDNHQIVALSTSCLPSHWIAIWQITGLLRKKRLTLRHVELHHNQIAISQVSGGQAEYLVRGIYHPQVR